MNKTDFDELTTPLVLDAGLRLGITLKIANGGIRSIIAGQKLAGRALPVQRLGSVDIFLEAIHNASEGDVLVIDNQGKTDEAGIGDLIALEAKANGIAGVVVWGKHRDTDELIEIGLPVFSYGSYPASPNRAKPRRDDALIFANFGDFTVTKEDFVLADSNGVLFAPKSKIGEIFSVAKTIRKAERKQADLIGEGKTLYQQFRFDEYLAKCNENANHTFREHLKEMGGVIE